MAFILSDLGFIDNNDLDNEKVIQTKEEISSFDLLKREDVGFRFRGNSILNLELPSSSKLLVKKRSMINGKVAYSNPTELTIESINMTDYVGFFVNQTHKMPDWDGVFFYRFGREELVNKVAPLFYNNDFWWLLGKFFSNGWLRIAERKGVKYPEYKVIIYSKDNNHDKETIYNVLMKLKLKFNKVEETTFTKFFIPNKELALFLKQFCPNAQNKHDKVITNDILNLPTQQLNAFLNGFVGDENKNSNSLKIEVKNEKLAYGIGSIFLKLFHKPYNIKKERKLIFDLDEFFVVSLNKKEQCFFEDGVLFMMLNEFIKVEEKIVFLYPVLPSSLVFNNLIVKI